MHDGHEQPASLAEMEAILDNTLLTPEALGELIPGYRNYIPTDNPLIYERPGAYEQLQGASHLVVALLAPSAVGKDGILNLAFALFERSMPQPTPALIVTETTRQRRPAEPTTAGQDPYHFIGRDTFTMMQDMGLFIEAQPKGQELYGTTRIALERAIDTSSVSFWRGGLDGIEVFRANIKRTHPEVAVITVVVLPFITLDKLKQRIIDKRGSNDAASFDPYARIKTALDEIFEAPHQADFLLGNPPVSNGEPLDAALALVTLTQQLTRTMQSGIVSASDRPMEGYGDSFTPLAHG